MSEEEETALHVDCEPNSAEYVSTNVGVIVAPAGWDYFADQVGALLVRTTDKTGDVEILESLEKPWRIVGKANRTGTLKAIPKDGT